MITVQVGETAYTLRTLTLDEGRAWIAQIGRMVEALDVRSLVVSGQTIASLAGLAIDTQLDALLARDVDGVLPDRTAVGARITAVDLWEALRAGLVEELPWCRTGADVLRHPAFDGMGPILAQAAIAMVGAAIAHVDDKGTAPVSDKTNAQRVAARSTRGILQ